MTAYGKASFNVLFCLLAIGVKARFKIINEIVKNSQNIKSLASLHAQLVELTSLVNGAFALTIAFFMTVNLNILILTFFQCYVAGLSVKKSNFMQNIFSQLIWNSFLFKSTIFIVFSSWEVKEGAKNTKKVCDEVLRSSKCSKTRKRMEIFALQLKSTHVKLGCGLFDFDWKMITMVSVF